MEPLDGLYRHRGATVTWDGDGITLTHREGGRSATARWDRVAGARHVGPGSGYVQLWLRGQAPALDYRQDELAFPVNSDQDANRLVTSIRWHSAATGGSGRPRRTWHRGFDRLNRRWGAGSRSPLC